MGVGEREMRTWGYVGSSMAIVSSLFAFICAIMMIVVIKTDSTSSFRDNSLYLAIFTMIVAVATIAVGGVSVWKIFQTNQIYLQVTAKAGSGQIQLTSSQPVVSSTRPVVSSPQPVVPSTRAVVPSTKPIDSSVEEKLDEMFD